MEDYRCIVCSRPVDENGFFGSISDMQVSLCREHAEECNRQCSNCALADICQAKTRGSGLRQFNQ